MSSRSFRNHNPGNLRYSPFTSMRGAEDDGEHYAKWSLTIQGLAALLDLLAARPYRDMNIRDAINRFAPVGDNNDPDKYIDFICRRSGIDQLAGIEDLDPFEILRLLEAIVVFEGWKP